MNRVLFLLLIFVTLPANAIVSWAGGRPSCVAKLEGKRMSFGNASLQTYEIQLLERMFVQKVDHSLHSNGALALFLSMKGVPLEIATSPGHTSPLIWSDANELLLTAMKKGTAVGSALERSDIFDIRLAPKVYVYWAALAMRTLVTISEDRNTPYGQVFLQQTGPEKIQDFFRTISKELKSHHESLGNTNILKTLYSPWNYQSNNRLGEKQEQYLIEALNLFTASELEALFIAQMSGTNVVGPHPQDVAGFEKDFAARIEILMSGGFNGATARVIAKMMEDTSDYMGNVRRSVLFINQESRNTYLDWSDERLEKFKQTVFNSSLPEGWSIPQPAPLP